MSGSNLRLVLFNFWLGVCYLVDFGWPLLGAASIAVLHFLDYFILLRREQKRAAAIRQFVDKLLGSLD